MKKEQWINEVFQLLCKSQGEPTNDNERKNLRKGAELMATDDPPHNTSYFTDGFTPKDAHDEELSCA